MLDDGKMISHLKHMFRYVAWANRRSLDALSAPPEAHAEGLPLMSHLLAAEHVWLSRIMGVVGRYPVWPSLTLSECTTLITENESGYKTSLEKLRDEDLAQVISYRTFQGQECESILLDMFMQVITHGPYHRGQIAKIIGNTGGVASNTDYITFTREIKQVER